MKFIQTTLIITVLSCLHINYATSAAQTTPHRTEKQLNLPEFRAAARDLIFNTEATQEELAALVTRYGHSVTQGFQDASFVHKGQTLAHFLVNQQRYSLVLHLIQQFGETLNTPSSFEDPKRPGSTAFIALCLQSPSPENAPLQYAIAQIILHKNSDIAYQARPSDGMTPILAAACAHNISLMDLIHQYCPNAYYQTTNQGETPASIIIGRRSKSTTADSLLYVVQSAPHLLSAALVYRIIASCKENVLEELYQRWRLPITDQEIINAWDQGLRSKNNPPAAKIAMRNFIVSKCPHLQAQLAEIPDPTAVNTDQTPVNSKYHYHPSMHSAHRFLPVVAAPSCHDQEQRAHLSDNATLSKAEPTEYVAGPRTTWPDLTQHNHDGYLFSPPTATDYRGQQPRPNTQSITPAKRGFITHANRWSHSPY